MVPVIVTGPLDGMVEGDRVLIVTFSGEALVEASAGGVRASAGTRAASNAVTRHAALRRRAGRVTRTRLTIERLA
jgi:hypothetical protein